MMHNFIKNLNGIQIQIAHVVHGPVRSDDMHSYMYKPNRVYFPWVKNLAIAGQGILLNNIKYNKCIYNVYFVIEILAIA